MSQRQTQSVQPRRENRLNQPIQKQDYQYQEKERFEREVEEYQRNLVRQYILSEGDPKNLQNLTELKSLEEIMNNLSLNE